MGYIGQKLWDLFGKNYRIYWAKTIVKVWNLFAKKYGIYLAKLWDILVLSIY